MSMLGLIIGRDALVVGVEDDAETGGLRMYLGARYKGVYAIVTDEEDKATLRYEWDCSRGGHLSTAIPEGECLYTTADRP